MNFQTTTANSDGVLCVRITSDDFDKYTLLHQHLLQKKLQLIAKRTFDITVSAVLIFLFAPILLLVTILIKLTSRGPILYSNDRVGLNGVHFKCFKFRSMVVNHAVKHEDHKQALQGQAAGILHKKKNDTRITLIGKIIRKSSIDELPQLFNVLKGDMSIIGPRPLVPFMLKPYPEFSKIRGLVKPGITGLWQIRDREHNTSAEFMISHDTEYIENYSLMQDLKILIETPIAVLSTKGAY